jgi:hypothetical protein
VTNRKRFEAMSDRELLELADRFELVVQRRPESRIARQVCDLAERILAERGIDSATGLSYPVGQ